MPFGELHHPNQNHLNTVLTSRRMLRVHHEVPDLAALRKEGFVADMHFHTAYSHDCKTPVKDIITHARKLGIWVAFTDHNRIGGVLEARKYKEAPVIPGIELCSKEGKEVLAYFRDDKALERFYDERIAPGLKEKNALRSSRTPYRMAELLRWLSVVQCLVVLPHPFAPQPRRSYGFFNRRKNLLPSVDAIEVFNANVTRRANLAAGGWMLGLSAGASGGSDGHQLKWLGRAVTVSGARTPREHLEAIRCGAVTIHGRELKPAERAFNYAQTTVRAKIEKGVKGGLRKAASFPRRAAALPGKALRQL